EDTCAIVHADHSLQVIGKGAVTIVDGSHVRTDAYRGKGYRPLMVSGAVLTPCPLGTGSTCGLARCSPVRTPMRSGRLLSDDGEAEDLQDQGGTRGGQERSIDRAGDGEAETGPEDPADAGVPRPQLLVVRAVHPTVGGSRLVGGVAIQHDPGVR